MKYLWREPKDLSFRACLKRLAILVAASVIFNTALWLTVEALS